MSTLVKRKLYCFTKFWRRCRDPQPNCITHSSYFKLTVLNLPRKRSLAKGTFVRGFLISSRNSGSVCGFTSATSVAKQRSPCAWIAFLWLLPTNWFFVNRKICLYTENDIVKWFCYLSPAFQVNYVSDNTGISTNGDQFPGSRSATSGEGPHHQQLHRLCLKLDKMLSTSLGKAVPRLLKVCSKF